MSAWPGSPPDGPPPLGWIELGGRSHWSASLVPALVGTTLPFWLRPRGFAFRWTAATEFLLAVACVHAGFSVLLTLLHEPSPSSPRSGRWGSQILLSGACLAAGSLLGLHLHTGLALHPGVPASIFIVYGICGLFAATLYVAPPFRFHRRLGGETVLCATAGLIPLLGAYLVQVGDLTRTVYLASGPLVIATGFWRWMEEFMRREEDASEGRRTMVVVLGPRFARSAAVPLFALLFGSSLLLAALSRSIPPGALLALASLGYVLPAARAFRTTQADPARLEHALRSARALHLTGGLIMAASPLLHFAFGSR